MAPAGVTGRVPGAAAQAGVSGVSLIGMGLFPVCARRGGPAGVARALSTMAPGGGQAWVQRVARVAVRVPGHRGRGRRSCRGSCVPGPAHARRLPLPLAATAAAGPARRGGAPGLADSCFLLPPRLRCGAAGLVARALAESPLPAAARPAPARAPASPCSQASALASAPAARAPRRSLFAPAMLSFQYPDVYRDETAVSTPAPAHPAPRRQCRCCRRLQRLSPQPFACPVPSSPPPRPLFARNRPGARGSSRAAVSWVPVSIRLRAAEPVASWPPPKINGSRADAQVGRVTSF